MNRGARLTRRGSQRKARAILTTPCQARAVKFDPSGKVGLSRKAILKEGEGDKPRYSAEEKAAHKAAAPPEHTGFGGGRGGDRGGRPGGGGGRGGPRGPRR